MNILKCGLAALLLTVASVTSASAYSYNSCNGVPLKIAGSNVALYYNTRSFGGSYRTAILNAVAQFNNHPSPLAYTGRPTTTQALNNGRSEVWGTTDAALLQGGTAYTYLTWDCYWAFGRWVGNLKEGDVVFDFRNAGTEYWPWTPFQSKSSVYSYTGGKNLLQATAIHEFGHVAGLMHEARVYNVMGVDSTHINTSGSAARGYVGADAGAGLRFLYGTWSTAREDLGVAHWYRTGRYGEYSVHSRTRILDLSGNELSSFTVGSEPVYRVSRGQQVKVEFTYENVGKSAQRQRPVSFYISNDENITTSDRLISRGYRVSLGASRHSTRQFTVQIPTADLASGSELWLGVIANPSNNAPVESRRENNTSYIRISID